MGELYERKCVQTSVTAAAAAAASSLQTELQRPASTKLRLHTQRLTGPLLPANIHTGHVTVPTSSHDALTSTRTRL